MVTDVVDDVLMTRVMAVLSHQINLVMNHLMRKAMIVMIAII